MTLKNALVISCGLQTLHGLFISRPNISACPATLNAQLITALYDYQPHVTDLQPILAWSAVMQEAFVNLALYVKKCICLFTFFFFFLSSCS